MMGFDDWPEEHCCTSKRIVHRDWLRCSLVLCWPLIWCSGSNVTAFRNMLVSSVSWIRGSCWYSRDAESWQSECLEWRGQAVFPSLSSSWRWWYHCACAGGAPWHPRLEKNETYTHIQRINSVEQSKLLSSRGVKMQWCIVMHWSQKWWNCL